MKRSANEGESEGEDEDEDEVEGIATKFRGSMKIVEGLDWHDDLLHSNTSFYRQLETHVLHMVSQSTCRGQLADG